jgi:hyperpolarization activated cyclic nucleotide-gated potassium channel 2
MLEEQASDFKRIKFIIMPGTKFHTVWNIIVILLLFYTGTVVPFRTAFVDTTTVGMQYFEGFIDILFIIDLFVNFITAYENEDKRVEDRLGKIVVNYLSGWFLLDLFACIPFQFIFNTEGGGGGKYNKLVRLARLPRLYRLLRILRVFKIMKTMKQNNNFKKYFQWFRMNPGISRMLKVLILVIFLVHLTACFWYLTAKLDDFHPDTWVMRHQDGKGIL